MHFKIVGMIKDVEVIASGTAIRERKRLCEKQLDLVVMNMSGMHGDLEGLMGPSLKPIPALEPGESDDLLDLAAQGEDDIPL